MGERRAARRDGKLRDSSESERVHFSVFVCSGVWRRRRQTSSRDDTYRKQNGPKQPSRRAALPDAGGAEFWACRPCTYKVLAVGTRARERAREKQRDRIEKAFATPHQAGGGPNRKAVLFLPRLELFLTRELD